MDHSEIPISGSAGAAGNFSPSPGDARIPRLAELSWRSIRDHLHESWHTVIRESLTLAPMLIRVVRSRKTKHGDHRIREYSVITVNASGNCWQFTITLLHEIAHARVAHGARRRVAPHGREWKAAFRDLLLRHLPHFPPELAPVVAEYARDPLFSSGAHPALARALRRYDTADLRATVEELAPGRRFSLDGRRVFSKGPLLRTRYRCESTDGRVFLVPGAARVQAVYGE